MTIVVVMSFTPITFTVAEVLSKGVVVLIGSTTGGGVGTSQPTVTKCRTHYFALNMPAAHAKQDAVMALQLTSDVVGGGGGAMAVVVGAMVIVSKGVVVDIGVGAT